MSGAPDYNRKRQAPKMFVLNTDLKVQDQLDGTIRLQRGFLCQEQDRNRGDFLWVKVRAQHALLTHRIGLKRHRHHERISMRIVGEYSKTKKQKNKNPFESASQSKQVVIFCSVENSRDDFLYLCMRAVSRAFGGFPSSLVSTCRCWTMRSC